MSNDELLTRIDAAAFLSISPRTLDQWREQGALRTIERGRWIRFRRSDLEKFIQSNTTPAHSGYISKLDERRAAKDAAFIASVEGRTE